MNPFSMANRYHLLVPNHIGCCEELPGAPGIQEEEAFKAIYEEIIEDWRSGIKCATLFEIIIGTSIYTTSA
jgi:hypothetical protein